MKQYNCPKCGHEEPTAFEICPHCEIVVEKFHRPSVPENYRPGWGLRFSKNRPNPLIFFGGLLVFVLFLAAGTVHYIIDSSYRGNQLVKRDSFGFSEIIINVDKINALPRVVARQTYPIGFLVLQREGIVKTDEAIARERDMQQRLQEALEVYDRIIERRSR